MDTRCEERLVVALAAAASLLVATCSSAPPVASCVGDGSADTQCDARGAFRVDWTIDGMPAASACVAANATGVRIVSGPVIEQRPPCELGTLVVNGVFPGERSVVVELIDAQGITLSRAERSVQVVVGEIAVVAIDFRPPPPTSAGLAFSWLVNGQTGDRCPSGSMVTLESTSGPDSAPVLTTAPCYQGSSFIAAAPLGNYRFNATLSTPTPVVVADLEAVVAPGPTNFVPTFNFRVPGLAATGGAFSVIWTVNGAGVVQCPAHASIEVRFQGANGGGSGSRSCRDGFMTLPGMAAATYSYQVSLMDSGQVAQSAGTLTVLDGELATAAVDITCSFCTP